MKKEVVFRCQFGGSRYWVEVLEHPKKKDGVVYATYKDRRRLDTFTWGTLEGAIGSIMQEHPGFSTIKFVEVWQ